jgi:hypothetical protein
MNVNAEHFVAVALVPGEDRNATRGVHVPEANRLVFRGRQHERGLQLEYLKINEEISLY